MRVGENFCPGVVHAVPAKDGLLLRIRVPGGLLEAHQLRAVAEISHDFADGTVEITSRANLQIRAVRAMDLPHIREAVSSAGLLPSPQHDRARNIVTSPMAGVDAGELLDPRPLVHELDRRLRSEAAFAEMHPKFSFAIYGGDRRFSRDRDDVCLSAVRAGEATLLRLSLAGGETGFAVPAQHAVDVLLTAAATCMTLARDLGVPARARQISELPGALGRLVGPLLQWLSPYDSPGPQQGIEEAPLGVQPTAQHDRVNVIPWVPLGRLTAAQAQGVADLVRGCGADLRLAPWRGVLLASVPRSAAGNVVGKLKGMGLMCDGADGFRGLTACAGSTGCDAALADVRRDARAIAQLLAGRRPVPDWTVNLSGCEKQCARRHGATVDLVATGSGYDLSVAGQCVARGCSPAAAVDAVAGLHKALMAEVATQ